VSGVWRRVALGDVADVNPRTPRPAMHGSTPVSFVPMAAVDDVLGEISESIVRPYEDVRNGYTFFVEGDVLFAKITPCMENGKVAVARQLEQGIGFGSTEFHVIRPQRDVLPDWLHAVLRLRSTRDRAALTFTGTAGQQRVPASFLRSLQLRVPPVDEQERIVRVASAIKAGRRTAAASRARSNQLPLAIFNRLFNEDGDAPVRLGELVEIGGGGTPTRQRAEFWGGTIPWVSPKDMKPDEIRGSEDHITAEGVEAARLRVYQPPAVLVVVRGMILAHTVPIRITRAPVAINQDMKVLLPRESVSAEFIRWALELRHRELLSLVSRAAHGTCRLETDRLLDLQVPIPSPTMLPGFNDLVARAASANRMIGGVGEALDSLADLWPEQAIGTVSP
jgi:type I restriction enzyme, S subunit